MHTGRREVPGQEYPHLGSLAAKYLTSEQNPLPGFVHIQPGGGGLSGSEAAFLGPKYGSLVLGNGHAPANTTRAGSLGEAGAAGAKRSGTISTTDSLDAAARPRPTPTRPLMTRPFSSWSAAMSST